MKDATWTGRRQTAATWTGRRQTAAANIILITKLVSNIHHSYTIYRNSSMLLKGGKSVVVFF